MYTRTLQIAQLCKPDLCTYTSDMRFMCVLSIYTFYMNFLYALPVQFCEYFPFLLPVNTSCTCCSCVPAVAQRHAHRKCTHEVHTGNAYRKCIQEVYTGSAYRKCIQEVKEHSDGAWLCVHGYVEYERIR
jgi:hypothetical protein